MVNIVFTLLFAAGAVVFVAGTAWLTDNLPPEIAAMLPARPDATAPAPSARPADKRVTALAALGGSEAATSPVETAALPATSRGRPAPAPAANGPTFDVARVAPDGGSLFAGRSSPGATVIVAANGRDVATAVADSNGEWIALSDRPLAPGEVELTLRAKLTEAAVPLAGQSLKRIVAAPADGPARLVAAAPPAAPATAERPVRLAAASPAASATGVVIRSGGNGEQAISAPAPITFVTGEATLTPQGRTAAAELARFLIAQRPDGVTLSGHADERGRDGFNMDLSKRRLDTIGRLIREQGYNGNLVLLPKGESEPYAGVDRARLPRKDLWQLDRRVEVHLGSAQR